MEQILVIDEDKSTAKPTTGGISKMSKYRKEPTMKDFIEWATKNPDEAERFWNDELWGIIQDLEMYDYFGTEGFDKRFG